MAASVPQASAVDYVYRQQEESLGVCWKYDDMCGILTEKNTEIIHWVITSDNASTCTLSAYGWGLAPNAKYYAYYPYSQSYYKEPMTALPISYAAQTQKANNSTAHLAAYDYMTSQTVSTSDACHLDFLHLGSVMRVECKMNTDCTLTALTLTAEKEDFVNTATMNATGSAVTPLTYAGVMTLTLDNVSLRNGETLVAYMMLPPADLSGQTLTLTLSSRYGEIYTAEVKGTQILPGHLYPLAMDMPIIEEDDEDDTDTDAADSELYAQSVNPTLAAAAQTIIKTPTAFAPDFTADPLHRFEVIEPTEEESAIVSNEVKRSRTLRAYSINGMKADRSLKGNVIIKKAPIISPLTP